MAESVDASVSNTDRETCAGSTPARGTEQAGSHEAIGLLCFYEQNKKRTYHEDKHPQNNGLDGHPAVSDS